MEEKDDDENSSLSTSLLVVTATTTRISKSSSTTNDSIDTTTNTTTHTTSVKEVTSKSKNKQQNLRLRHRHRRGRDEGGGGSGGNVCPNITTKCCYYCGMMGHDTGGCPTKMKDDEKRKNHKKKKRDEIIKKQVSDHSLDAMHFKMYKPSKVLSQFVFTGKKLKGNKLLGEFYDFPSGIMSIGRLDANSEGLLLLTKCGKTSYKYTSPTSSTEKEYYVQVLGQMTFDDINKLCNGVNIQTRNETFTTAPCIVRLIDKKNDPYIQQFFTDDDEEELRQSKDDDPSSNIICTGTSNAVTDDGSHHHQHHHHHHYPRHRRIKSTSWISITIMEGKFRQVRKMTASVGYPTLRLIRVRIGHITLFDVDDDDDNKDGNNNKKDKKMVNMMTPGQVIEIENL